MLNRYSDIEKAYTKKITTAVVYSGGGVTYEEAWSMSFDQLELLDETVREKIELMTKIGKMSLF
jgi:hypothetical protein